MWKFADVRLLGATSSSVSERDESKAMTVAPPFDDICDCTVAKSPASALNNSSHSIEEMGRRRPTSEAFETGTRTSEESILSNGSDSAVAGRGRSRGTMETAGSEASPGGNAAR